MGRIPTILVGQVILLASLLFTGFGSENELAVVIGLVLLGLGWSAATVAGSTLLSESTIIEKRAARQGVSDLVMSGSGAAGGALAGVVLAFLGYSGLSFVALALLASVVARITLTRAKASTPASGSVEPVTYDI